MVAPQPSFYRFAGRPVCIMCNSLQGNVPHVARVAQRNLVLENVASQNT